LRNCVRAKGVAECAKRSGNDAAQRCRQVRGRRVVGRRGAAMWCRKGAQRTRSVAPLHVRDVEGMR